MSEIERCITTRRGPCVIRDRLGVAQPGDDASDELSDESGNERLGEDETAQPSCSGEQSDISPLKPIRDNLCFLKAVAFPLKVSAPS